ncbi:unnamed protein product [Euphydryas editha]|uniref:CRAL-TRIO domain-containing protein n=1 Tax=Euphydryas editha TaxID=104508 RepID=A0AAU9U4I6_EUPED|nr:unnamed protein product [Euphydryas editha]
MESTPYHTLFRVTKEEMMAVRQDCNLDIKKINENLDILEEWCRSQEHLVEALPYLDRDMLERFHIQGRGSIEQTKIRIEKALTIRGMLQEFLLHDEPKKVLDKLHSYLDNILLVSLPKVNPKDGTRVFLAKLMNENFEDINLIEGAKFSCFVIDVRMNNDYIFSDRVIFDLQHIKSSFITKFNPVIVKKVAVFFTEAYKFKVKGFHIINAPPYFNKLLQFFKAFVKEKLINRVYIHNSFEELYQEIPKEILPKEYGGEEMSCTNLAEEWRKYFKTEEVKRIIEHSNKLVSNESRRSVYKFNEEYFGIPGSFKQINVD